MRKISVLVMTVLLVFALSACGNNKSKKAQEAYDAIGPMSFSDESILTKDEKDKLAAMKSEREEALKDKNVEKLQQLKTEWESFSEPINAYISKYESYTASLFPESDIQLLTPDEKTAYESITRDIRSAYQNREEAKLDELLKEYDKEFSWLSNVLKTYREIKFDQYTDAEMQLLSTDSIYQYNDLRAKVETALSDRDLAELQSLERQWSSFSRDLSDELYKAKNKLLQDWVDAGNLTGSMTELFSLGTITQETTLSGHTITSSTKYNADYLSDDEIKKAFDLYISSFSGFIEDSVKHLKTYVDDVCIRIEYKNSSGSVVSSKEFR